MEVLGCGCATFESDARFRKEVRGWLADAVTLDESGDALQMARAAVTNARTTIQVHGGMGFTWEAVPHLYLKRAWLLQNAFTTPEAAAETVAGALVPLETV